MNLTYILIDFENVKPTAADCDAMQGSQYRLWIFRGPTQNKFDGDVVDILQPLGERVKHVRNQQGGKNALDFLIAFHLGRLIEGSGNPGAFAENGDRFFIVSKDKGFDALLAHVRKMGYSADRAVSLRAALGLSGDAAVSDPQASPESSTLDKPSSSKSKAAATKTSKSMVGQATEKLEPVAAPTKKVVKQDPWARTIENLRDHPNNRPTTIKRLESHLGTLFKKEKSPELVGELMARLQREGVAILEGKRIAYKFPKA